MNMGNLILDKPSCIMNMDPDLSHGILYGL